MPADQIPALVVDDFTVLTGLQDQGEMSPSVT